MYTHPSTHTPHTYAHTDEEAHTRIYSQMDRNTDYEVRRR